MSFAAEAMPPLPDHAAGHAVLPARLRECPDCGLLQRLPPLPRGAVARCPRCSAVLRRRRIDPAGRALALAATALLLFALALTQPFISVSVYGLGRATSLFSGPVALEEHGAWPLAIAVLVTMVAVPLLRLGALTYVLLGIQLPHPPRHLYAVFRWVEWLGPWSMAEVFMLGVLVAYTRLIAIARVEVGLAVYALGALTLVNAAAIAVLDPEAIWQRLEQRGVTAGRPEPIAPGAPLAGLHGCDSCGMVSRNWRTCPRCGARLRVRKTDSIRRTWALLIAGALLYLPANFLPVLSYSSFGHGHPATILDGVIELAMAGLWPLAALVFFASITVPMLKLLGLGWLLISTQRGSVGRLRERTVLYRIVEQVGRWSMIDVFMISILTALVRMGFLASVEPQPGAIAFCSVVILTMIAAQCFDPRLMWDAAATVRSRAAP
jgi:paraquat-inducible protein A